MRNYGCLVPTAAFCGMALFSVTYSCPMFVEFFPDPKTVSDDEGEYVEIRLDEYRAESLFVRFESKEIMAFEWPEAERLLLLHDTLMCPQRTGVACRSLGKVTLPNSRESVWKLWAGSCVDSVVVERPKPGKAQQRVGLTDEWVYVDGTMGYGDAEYELGVAEDSLLLALDERVKQGRSLMMTEIHHCPEEPMPEWVEVYNAGAESLPLEMFRFCDRGSNWGRAGDSILPYQTLLLSKDTAALRAAIGIPDIRLVQVALGYLNNTEGALRLCYRNEVVDSVSWNKATVACPSGFNPLTGLRDFTPGYQQKKRQSLAAGTAAGSVSAVGSVPESGTVPEKSTAPVLYKLSSRVVSKKGPPIRIRVESDYDVRLSLLDSAGRRVWQTVVSASSYDWVKVPVQENLGIGVADVALSVGEYEDVVGILVRP